MGAKQTMYHKLFLWKFLILKLVSGLHIILSRDLDMALGFMKETYLYMEAFNFQVQLFRQTLSLKSVYHNFSRIILIFMGKLLILTHLFHQWAQIIQQFLQILNQIDLKTIQQGQITTQDQAMFKEKQFKKLTKKMKTIEEIQFL